MKTAKKNSTDVGAAVLQVDQVFVGGICVYFLAAVLDRFYVCHYSPVSFTNRGFNCSASFIYS